MPTQDSPTPPNGRLPRATAYVVTNGTKVVGLYLGIKEVARETVRESVLIFAAVLAMGAQAVENIVIAAIDRFFGRGEK